MTARLHPPTTPSKVRRKVRPTPRPVARPAPRPKPTPRRCETCGGPVDPGDPGAGSPDVCLGDCPIPFTVTPADPRVCPDCGVPDRFLDDESGRWLCLDCTAFQLAEIALDELAEGGDHAPIA